MNALWNLIASYLPSIRISNDLEDNYPSDDDQSDDGSYELPTTALYYPPMTITRKPGQRHDRPLSYGALDTHHATDPDRLRVKHLETFNNRLQDQVLSLQRQLEHLQADLSSTKMELDHHRSANSLLVSQKGQLSVELAQACAARQAQATEVHKLRTSYTELASSVRALESNGEELRTLKSFLTKTDDFSGQQIVQAVHDLNTEILQLAAAVSDEFPLSRCSPGLWKESHCELVREAIGDGMLALLRDGDHENDPTVVQLAIQAWEVRCCQQVLDAFCAGIPVEVDRFLNDIFREMQSSGRLFVSISYLIPIALTPKHLHTQNRKRRPPVGEHSPICTHGAHYLLTAHLPQLIPAPFLHHPLSPLYRSPHTPHLGPRQTIPQIIASSRSRCRAPEHHRTHQRAPSTIPLLALEATLVASLQSFRSLGAQMSAGLTVSHCVLALAKRYPTSPSGRKRSREYFARA